MDTAHSSMMLPGYAPVAESGPVTPLHSVPPDNLLAVVGRDSQYTGTDNRPYTGNVSYVRGVVPTGLFTTYVPAGQIAGQARQAAYASQADFQKVHESRIATIRDRGTTGNASTPAALTVYYTDDLYPPYYAKARRVQSQKRGKPQCCQ
eukprot:Protomagalhaensia_sp_Gyna_25__5383@NODE_693_length_2825_cov_179_693826_g541_i0_p2_GENE_NODE_693_length_2825_cov_179_693826_g541_i0NODE_693_length_2825_cov_179_693826_g541_i0_p2_ORF_typecomplete_len149_score16_83AalphaY_MDB/PF04611_12/0_14_NODE_693_length_2825_cov_179_693826_g541_i022532699